MSAALALVQPAPSLSPGRTALATHLAALTAARSAATAARTPWRRLQEPLTEATRQVADAEVALAAIDDLEAADLASWAQQSGVTTKPAPRAKQRGTRERTLEAARRELATVERAVADQRPAMEAADAEVAVLERRTLPAIASVLREERAVIVARLEKAAADFAAAQAAVVGLARHASELGRSISDMHGPDDQTKMLFTLAEETNEAGRRAVARDMTRADVDASAARWRTFAAALAGAATAQLE